MAHSLGILKWPYCSGPPVAMATKESGAWLNALPVTSLGLRLYNELVRIAVGLCLG